MADFMRGLDRLSESDINSLQKAAVELCEGEEADRHERQLRMLKPKPTVLDVVCGEQAENIRKGNYDY